MVDGSSCIWISIENKWKTWIFGAFRLKERGIISLDEKL